MATLIDTERTTPAEVIALVSTWRYFKHDLETAIDLLNVYKGHRRKADDTDGLTYMQAHDLVVNLEDILHRGSLLERVTHPQPKKASKIDSVAANSSIDETF